MPISAFADLLTLIDERSAALRAAADKAGTDARVPGCPDWSVRDLLTHLSDVQLFWAAVVAAGPAWAASGPPADLDLPDMEADRDLLGWSAESTGELLAALREAGPDRPCWAWWAASGAPLTSGAIARHQVQEAAVHGFDAQQAAGQAQPLPLAVAADGIGEFLTVPLASLGDWPHAAASVALVADDGPAWVVSLSGAGARAREDAGNGADARLRGSASDLVLALYQRQTVRPVQIDGDRELARRLLAWSDND